MQDYSYLKPPSKIHAALIQETTETSRNNNQKSKRAMFGSTDRLYSGQETEALHRLKEYLKHKDGNKKYSDELLLRFCYLGSFRTADSVEKFRVYQEWQNMPQIQRNIERSILHSGVFYTYGRDQGFSPNIYFTPSLINLNDYQIRDYLVSLRTLLRPVEDHMIVPGKIQNWNVIVNLKGFDESKIKNNQEVCFNNLTKIMIAYPYRLKALFIVQSQASKYWRQVNLMKKSAISNLFARLDLNKNCITISTADNLDRYIPKDEREKQYGGNLEDLCEFWPIQSTNKLMEVNSQFIDQSALTSEYASVMNDENEEFFFENNQSAPLCDLKQCVIF